MAQKTMGTVSWGESGSGVLSRSDRFTLIRNLAFVQSREMVDAIRQRLNLLPLPDEALDSLRPPTRALANDALSFARDTHSEALMFHSLRTYFMGRLIAAQCKIEYDDDIFFAAAMLHDLGLTSNNPVAVSQCCFAVHGAARAKAHLDSCGHDHSKSDKVSEAIALHLNIHVSKRLHGAEAHLLARGATCDLFGFGRRRIQTSNLKELFHRYPRDGVIEALRFETADHLKGSRAEFLTRLSKGKAPRTPFFDSDNLAKA